MNTAHTVCDFSPESVGRADRVVQQLTGLSRAGVRGLFDHGCVRVNRDVCTNSAARAANGDLIEVQHDPHRRYKEMPTIKADPAFDVLFEDEHLIVVNKAAHVLTVPTTGEGAGGEEAGKTLVHALNRHINRGRKGARRVFVVHRLDRGTSGVLVFGKSQKIASQLKSQFAAHKPERVYLAIVAGMMEKKKGTIESHLATDLDLNRYSTKDADKGELAITHYEVVKGSRDEATKRRSDKGKRANTQHSVLSTQCYSVVRVQLETGRRNQIRVHFAEAGHPVLGDPRYRPDLAQTNPKWKHKRLALHAASLEFMHPVTGKVTKFEAKMPAEFVAMAGSMPPSRGMDRPRADERGEPRRTQKKGKRDK